MADITRELAAIMSAVFGRDVRQSIYDAIDKINKVSEVQMNAGTAITSPSSSSEGFYDGSLYINTNTYELWKCTGANTWVSLGILKGTDGRSIVSITGPVSSGVTDTYTINFSDGTSSAYSVVNGVDGIDGSQWYKSTAITGTGSGMTGFPAKVNDFLINPTLGYIYQCTATGGATGTGAATWDWVMAITGGSGGSITVVDGLQSTSAYDALSANQGRNLNQKKIEKPATATQDQILRFDGTDWIADDESEGGHVMYPDPTSTSPGSAAAEEAAIVAAVKAKMTSVGEGWANQNVGSLNSIGVWSNMATKTFTVSGTANNSPIGVSGIGQWYDGDIEDFDPTTDEVGWIPIPALVGIGSNTDVDVSLLFDPATCSMPITLGGYIIDDTTGKMCIKFGVEIEEEDTETAVIGIELTFKRTETTPVSF